MNNCYRYVDLIRCVAFLLLLLVLLLRRSMFYLIQIMNCYRESTLNDGEKKIIARKAIEKNDKENRANAVLFAHTIQNTEMHRCDSEETLTNDAIWKLANATKFTNHWCMLISAIINGQPIVRTMM